MVGSRMFRTVFKMSNRVTYQENIFLENLVDETVVKCLIGVFP